MLKTIDQFIWPYQQAFRAKVQILVESVFKAIGFDTEPEVFLVALAKRDAKTRHSVCIEPEAGRWKQSLFASLVDDAEAAFQNHPLQSMFYGSRSAMEDKPEHTRRLAMKAAVEQNLAADEKQNGVKSFCGKAVPIGDYYVVTVIQVDERETRDLPAIRHRWRDDEVEVNLVKYCLDILLAEAEEKLSRSWPDPGKDLGRADMLTAQEIAVRAASAIMRISFIAGDEWGNGGLYELIEEVTKLLYEGETSTAKFILTLPDDPNLNYVVRFRAPVPLSEPRWLRKLMQMATGDAALIISHVSAFGVGFVSDVSAPYYSIEVLGRHHWELRRGETVYLQVKNGEPKLPQKLISPERFAENMRRILGPDLPDSAVSQASNIMDVLYQLGRGSMIVFCKDAVAEAERLDRQGSRIKTTGITRALLQRATMIDGTILADANGSCYAIGVILDGTASELCKPSRGSRYNSAVRYVGDGSTGRMALVVSDDGTLDVVPLLREQVDEDFLETLVVSIEIGDSDAFRKARKTLVQRRFYFNANQCDRINDAISRLHEEARKSGEIFIREAEFVPNPEMNSSYYKPKKSL